MSTSEIIQKTFVSSDGKSLILTYNPADNSLVSAAFQNNGTFTYWKTIADFKDFMTNAIDMLNTIHSVSGSGSGYTAATAGTDATTDKIVD